MSKDPLRCRICDGLMANDDHRECGQCRPMDPPSTRFRVLRVFDSQLGEKWVMVDIEDPDFGERVVLDQGGELLLKAIAKRLNADPPTPAELSEPF